MISLTQTKLFLWFLNIAIDVLPQQALRSLSHHLLLLQHSSRQLTVFFPKPHSLGLLSTTIIPPHLSLIVDFPLPAHKDLHTAGSTFHSENPPYDLYWFTLSLHHVLHYFGIVKYTLYQLILHALLVSPTLIPLP